MEKFFHLKEKDVYKRQCLHRHALVIPVHFCHLRMDVYAQYAPCFAPSLHKSHEFSAKHAKKDGCLNSRPFISHWEQCPRHRK